MIIKDPKFELSCVSPEQFPQNTIPEVAFVGRSNVGKSSIINALLNRKRLAKVGQTPGMTRMINFFNIDKTFYFVDLPGYGYASVSREKKKDWAYVIEKYLNSREQLKLIVLLVDIRHAPSKEDVEMLDWIKGYNIPYIVTATKYDKITRNQLFARLKEIRSVLTLAEDTKVIPFSSENKHGKEELLDIMSKYMNLEV